MWNCCNRGCCSWETSPGEQAQMDYGVYDLDFSGEGRHGFRSWACRPRRPQTKGKVERRFAYVEGNLLNGRTFAALAQLNDVTAGWQEHVADVSAESP